MKDDKTEITVNLGDLRKQAISELMQLDNEDCTAIAIYITSLEQVLGEYLNGKS